jgi:hypothetical protein
MFKKIGFVLVALAVMAAGLGTGGPAQAGLMQAPEREDNCAVTPFDIAGQGRYSIGGASGGSVPPGFNQSQIVDTSDPDLHIVRSIGSQPAAILVVDDFFEYKGEIPHGRLVTDQMIEMIQASNVYGFEPKQINDEPVVWLWSPGKSYGDLYLIEVDTEDYDTDQLQGRVENAVNLAVEEYGASRVVLNMSFVLIPCITPDYDLKVLKQERSPGKSDHKTLIGEVAKTRDLPVEIQTDPRNIANSSLLQSTETRDAANVLVQYARQAAEDPSGVLDPLHDYIQKLVNTRGYWNGGQRVIVVAVGSAGNFGRGIDSFVPAAWPEVVSVSASLAHGNAWSGSNKGQVMLPGGLFPLDDLYLIGTSFSAPVMSMNMAFYLTNDPVCADPPLDLDLTSFKDHAMKQIIDEACSPPFK